MSYCCFASLISFVSVIDSEPFRNQIENSSWTIQNHETEQSFYEQQTISMSYQKIIIHWHYL